MDTFQDNFDWSFKAKHPFKVIVVGAGIAGLTAALGLKKAGHDVLILERVPEIAEVGAGIQVAPNAARILGRLGLLGQVMEKANVLEKNSLRRYANNEELGTAPLMPKVRIYFLLCDTLLDSLPGWPEIQCPVGSHPPRRPPTHPFRWRSRRGH